MCVCACACVRSCVCVFLAWGWELERAGCLRGWGFTVRTMRTMCVGGLDCVSCVSDADGLCVCSLVTLVVYVCVFHFLRLLCLCVCVVR